MRVWEPSVKVVYTGCLAGIPELHKSMSHSIIRLATMIVGIIV
jgi:hypothetical protein